LRVAIERLEYWLEKKMKMMKRMKRIWRVSRDEEWLVSRRHHPD